MERKHQPSFRGMPRLLRFAVAMPLTGLALLLVLASIAPAPASAGQIVYEHGADIWAINDDGSGAHPIVTVAQVPGMSSIDGPAVFPNGGASVAFEGTTLAYLAPVGSGPAGSCGLECTGVYTLADGAVTRLTPAAAQCGPAPAWCGSFSTSPSWMANGNIAYEYDLYTWEYSCLTLPCGWRFNDSSVEEIDVVPPAAGAFRGAKWNVEHGRSVLGAGPIPDPADAAKLAYVGDSICEPGGCLYPLYTGTGNGADTPVAYDDDLIEAAWSPDGGRFADVEGGGERGIWTYAADAASTPGKQFVWALTDPLQTGSDPGENPFDVTFKGVAWLGTSKLVFSADDNLWTIPASCGSGGGPCQFPRDATQLTTDGSAAAPNLEPSWTSSTAPLSATPSATPAPTSTPTQTQAPTPAPRESGKHGGTAQPRLSGGALRGVARRRARLSFTVLAGGKSPLKKLAVRLSRGLGFAKARRRLLAGISLRGSGAKKLKIRAGLSHGVLTIALRKPAGRVKVTIAHPAILVGRALAAKVRRGKAKRLRVNVEATATGGKGTRLRLSLRPK